MNCEKKGENVQFDIFSVKENRFEAKNGKKSPKKLITKLKGTKTLFGV